MNDLEKILGDRRKEYGDFEFVAAMTRGIMNAMDYRCTLQNMAADQYEAMHMIAQKQARIANGNANNVDSWKDIAGYAMLIANRLASKERDDG